MLRYADTELAAVEICAVSKYHSKLLLRENITLLDDGRYSYNEYSLLQSGPADSIDIEAIQADFDTLIEAAKIEESLRIKEQEIAQLKTKLNDSDYRVLKCAESYMLGAVLPYDFSQLLTERNTIRDNINELQDSTEVNDLEVAKTRKITEMCAICQTTITTGIDYNGEHYRLNTTDQINLTSLYTLAQAGQVVPYHADGAVCRMYEPAEMIGLVQTSIQWITYHTTYFNLLKHQILEMTTLDEVNAVVYGMTLKDEYQAIINIITGQ